MYTVRKIIHSSFVRKRMVGGGDPFYLKFWVNRSTALIQTREAHKINQTLAVGDTSVAPLVSTSPVDVQAAEPTLGDTSIVSQSVTNNRCAPSWGKWGAQEKNGDIKKIFGGRALGARIKPPLANSSDATTGNSSQ